MYNNDYLMHHGVKGMKWGVRKDPVYESRRTRRLRTGIESYDEDIKDPTFSPRAHKMLVKDREKLYNKYNKSKDRDLKRKNYAVRHPSHLRNFAAMQAKGAALAVPILAAGGAVSLYAKSKGKNYDVAIARGMRAAATLGSAQLLYTHVERGKAIEAVYDKGGGRRR